MKYYETMQRDQDYKLLDGTVLRCGNDPKTGEMWYEASRDGKRRAIKNAKAFLAMLNKDVAQSLLPAFRKARTPEEIIELSQLISSTRGRTSGPEVSDTYRTPDGRTYQMTYYAGTLTEWGYVE